MLKLVLQVDILLYFSIRPKYPFVGKSFEIQVILMDCEQIKCGLEVPLLLSMFLEDSNSKVEDTPLPESAYSVGTRPVVIGVTGIALVRITLNDVSMSFENKRFFAKFEVDFAAIQRSGEATVYRILKDVTAVQSNRMLCVRYRLVIRADVPDTPTPDVWYKDDGGRDNKIDLHVQLLDSESNRVSDRRVPLKVLLVYGSGEQVLQQNLLLITPESKQYIDESGMTLLRVRINDVSKNHQRQKFSVLVRPDTSREPFLNDISPDVSKPVEVKSKRSKRPAGSGSSSLFGNHHPSTSMELPNGMLVFV